MLSNVMRGGVLAAFLFASTTSAQQPIPQPVPGAVTGKTYRAKEVLGTKILLKGEANSVGVVDDLVFDDGGNMEYLIVGNGDKLFTVPFAAAAFDPEKRIAVLPITMEQFKVIPTYTTATYPAFYAPAYRVEIHKHYGIAPRDLRVIRRR